MKRLIPLMLALLLILPNIAYGADEKKKYNILVSTYFPVDEFTSAQNTMIKWFGEDQGVNVYWAETDKDCRGDVQVRNAMAILNTRRIDGVLLSSPDAKPTRVITDYCKEKGIPVIGFQEPTDSPDMLMFVGTVPNLHGASCGEAMIKALKDRFGEARGKVLIVDTTPASVTHHSRTLGFIETLGKEKGITYDRLEVRNISADESKKAVSSYLELGNDFDAVWGPSGAMAEGAIMALEAFPKTKPADKVIVGSEAYSMVMQGIRDGYVAAVPMPAAHYQGVIAFKYLLDYLAGKPLPQVGDTIEDFTIENGQPRKGFNPWDAEYIKASSLPATMTTMQKAIEGYPGIQAYYTFDYPFWSQDVPILTKEQGDAPWVWGNFPYRWEEEVR